MVGFQILARCLEERLLAAVASDNVPLSPNWLAKFELVVYASPQRSGGPWRRVPRAAVIATTRHNASTPKRTYHAVTIPWLLELTPNPRRGRVARSAPLNNSPRIQLATAQASK